VARGLADTQAALDESLEAVPGVRAAIDALVAEGYAICVGSSGRPEKIERNLATAELIGLFGEGAIFSAVQVPRGKPEPDLFLLAAETMGVEPSRCVVVEDSRYGIAAAGSAGMRSIGFAGGMTRAGDLADADLIIDDMAKLPRAVADVTQA
jgi:HAD superfamily hydrolase (TIGR01509 family)